MQRVIENARESQVLLWIWKVLDEVSEFDYDQYLRDGVVLCRYISCMHSYAFICIHLQKCNEINFANFNT